MLADPVVMTLVCRDCRQVIETEHRTTACPSCSEVMSVDSPAA